MKRTDGPLSAGHAPLDASAKMPSDSEVDDILALFTQPDLTMQEAEDAIERLQAARGPAVDKLLALLEAGSTPEGPTLHLSRMTGVQHDGWIADRDTDRDAILVLLSYLGDERIVPRLMTLVDDVNVTDEFKLKLISVIHEFDPQKDTEALLDHLKNPFKAIQQSHRQHVQRLGSPFELSLWLEMMAEEMPVEARISFAHTSAEIDDPVAVPLLICMCYDPDDDVVLAALDAVERYKDARALPTMQELASYHPHEQVRNEALKAADRLGIRAALAPQTESAPPPPPYACYLTTIDGSGRQVSILIRQTSPETLRLVELVFSDDTGIEECFGTDLYVGALDDMLDELATQSTSPVQVSYEQWLTALDMACEATWKAGRLLPATFIAWREWLTWERTGHDAMLEEANSVAHAPQAAHPGSSIPVEERARLLHNCHELLIQDEFMYWFFRPDEVGDLGDVYWRLVEERGADLETSALRALLRRGVREIVTDRMRGLIRERLWRVAPLLRELYEDQEVWQWAAVAADALVDDSPLPPEEHPLLLAMVGCSLENVVGETINWPAAIQ
jgi:hypothetical protein